IVSEEAGTTTDVVEKAQELHTFGPVLWLDTAGFGDETSLSQKRMDKTLKVLDRADAAVLVLDDEGETEKQIELLAAQKKIPLLKVFNKKEKCEVKANGNTVILNALDVKKRPEAVEAFEKALLSVCGQDFEQAALLGDLVPQGGLVLMIIPIDFEAPKGRLILPQVQAIRDCLDHNQMVMICKETEYVQALSSLKQKPDLVVCDSQVVKFMIDNTPKDIKCTTFSALMARLKGDVKTFAEGAKMIWKLESGDKVLISESCTHHAAKDDIGTVKIPTLMRNR
ncbi:MAG: 50S ribosome-binding GTPase, partial [Alphaproteobacteria bacterium]|nr:50S ribosome-binding GTPase [Alphaproteobacteria bacterium]